MNGPSEVPDWRILPTAQQPDWPDQPLHREVLDGLAAAPPLVAPGELPLRYHTACDPRLNRSQSLELASLVAELMREGRRPDASASDEETSRTVSTVGPAAERRATPGRSTSRRHQPLTRLSWQKVVPSSLKL